MSKDIQHRKQAGLAVAAAFAVATLFVPQAASAQLINPLDTIKLTDGPGSGPGGQFTATILSGVSAGGSFQTFCLEHSETFSWGETLQVKTITAGARAGGPGASVIGGVLTDLISDQTAWLYTQFRSTGYGALTGYGGADQANDADALQNVFWFLEQEITSLTSGLNTAGEIASATSWLAAANTAVAGGWTNANHGNKVQVLNLYKGAPGYTAFSQDQLYLSPVPEPETYAMLLAGLGLMGFVARRRKLKVMSG